MADQIMLVYWKKLSRHTFQNKLQKITKKKKKKLCGRSKLEKLNKKKKKNKHVKQLSIFFNGKRWHSDFSVNYATSRATFTPFMNIQQP